MRNQKGFTLIESLVALGLMSLVFAISGYQMYKMNEMKQKAITQAENITTMSFSENFIWDKLRTVGVGYNVLNVLDSGGRNFFDFNSDVPESFIPAATRGRRIVMSREPGGITDLFLMNYDFDLSSTALYEPAAAYSISENSPTTTSTFTYSGINSNGSIKARIGAGWAPGKLFLMINPVPLRATNAAGLVNMADPSRPMVFLGRVTANEADLTLESLPFVRRNDPRNLTNQILTPDQFFRNLPLAAGSAPLVEIIPVKIIRFWLEANPKKPSASILYYGNFENGTTVGRFVLSDDVSSLIFERSSITSRLIAAQVCSSDKADLCRRP